MVVVEFILGLLQRLLLTLDLFFFGFLTMFSLLFNRVFFVVRERTRRCGGRYWFAVRLRPARLSPEQ